MKKVNIKRGIEIGFLMLLIGAGITPIISAISPVACFTWSPQNPVIDEIITFNASCSSNPDGGSIIAYSWDWENDNIDDAFGITQQHTFNSIGTYTVKLYIMDDDGETEIIRNDVIVSNLSNNQPPYPPSNPEPLNGTTNISINPLISVFVDDPDNDSLNVTFYNAVDDSIIGINLEVPSGERVSVQWSGLQYNTTYTWYAEVNDASNLTYSEVWTFTTESFIPNNPPHSPYDPLPSNGSMSIEINPILSVIVNDADGDLLDVSFFDGSDNSLIGIDENVTSGSHATVSWNNLEYSTRYSWYTVVSDGNNNNCSEIWVFITKGRDTNEDGLIILTNRGFMQNTFDIINAQCGDKIDSYNQIDGFLPDYDAALLKINNFSINIVMDIIKDISNICYIENNSIVEAFWEPNDPYYVDNHQWNLKMINMPTAWNKTKGSSEIIVAVIDTGFDFFHQDKPKYIIDGYDFVNNDNVAQDDEGHGTHCSGIIAAYLDNHIGIAGMANVKIMPIKVLDYQGMGRTWWCMKGIKYAAENGADVISMSWGRYIPSILLKLVCEYASSKGSILIAAAGNGNKYGEGLPYSSYPAAFDCVISVGAIDKNSKKPIWTNYGDSIDVYAPGVSVYSLLPNNKYGSASGTSMACPHVAGAAALYISKNTGILSCSKFCKLLEKSSNNEILDVGKLLSSQGKSLNYEYKTNLQFSISTDKEIYQWLKDPVTISINLKNIGETLEVITFPTPKQFDFQIKTFFGLCLFQWSEKKQFAQEITNITLKPMEEINWNFTWTQNGHYFKWMPYHKILPGTYTIKATIDSFEIQLSTRHNFVITPYLENLMTEDKK